MDNVRQDGDKSRKKEDVYLKFPAILKEKLQSGEIHFPEKTHFEYQPIRAYRGIAREEEDDTPVNINDFRSYAEMGKKKTRGRRINTSAAEYYGVSLFTKREIVETLLAFPNPRKKMICGYVYCEGGPQLSNQDTNHVCWWLYEDVEVDKFIIC